MTDDLEVYFGYDYAVTVVPEQCTDGSVVYLAKNPELPGCMAHGETPEEAVQNLVEARALYINTLMERGLDVPKPCAPPLSVVWRRITMSKFPPKPDKTKVIQQLAPLGVSSLTPLMP